ncbi:MAG: hypothetical protein IKI76_11115 [Selenomonadaceae bacterium]|nr:hypothetical protein [Selenomonadaceae bacterium]
MTKAKAIAKNNTVGTATIEKFLAAKTHVGYKHNAAGAKIWYELDLAQIGDTKISKATAAELLKNGFGLTIDEYLAAQEQWIAQELARAAAEIAEDDRNEILSTPLVSTEAQDEAVKGEYANCARASLLAFAAMAPAFNAELKKVIDEETKKHNEIEQANATIKETDGSKEDDDEETIAAVIPTEDNDYDETDEPEILNADLFVNLYHSPMQELYASVTRSINGEQLHFFHHNLTHISAPALDLEVYFDNGRMNFWHGSKRIARDKVWQVPIIKETTKAQTESFGKFFAGDHTSKFFKVSVYPTFADGSEHNYVRYFDFFNQAQKFVEEVKIFVGDVPTQIYITSGGQYLYTRINGIENYTLPAVDVTEAQSRIDELNKAIADNESFADKCDDDLTASTLRVANSRLKRSIAYYEAALRMTEPASLETLPAFEDDKVYILHAHDIIGRPAQHLFKVKRGKMFGKKFLTIIEYIKRLNEFSVDAERYQIYTTSEGEYIKGIYAEDNLYHRLYAKDITEDPTIAPPVDTQTNQPDDFMTKLNDLSAAVAIANAEDRKARDAEVEAYNAWQAAKQKVEETADKYRAAINAYKTLGCQKAKELCDTLLENDIKLFSDANIRIINQQGEEVARPALSQIFITFYSGVFKVSASWDNFAIYDTPEEVTNVIEQLKAAIARGDKEFSFAPDDEPINQPDNSTPDKLRDSLARGMEECLIKTQEHLRANDISAALVENERYQICANALHEVKELIA